MSSLMEGPLSKWTNVMKGWQYRWFVLDDNAGLLSYYTVSFDFFMLTFHNNICNLSLKFMIFVIETRRIITSDSIYV